MSQHDERAERRRRREERREKQRAQNVIRAQKMHVARVEYEKREGRATSSFQRKAGTQAKRARRKTPGFQPGAGMTELHVGCSGWHYWHWGGSFYPDVLPRTDWFQHYAKHFDTVELNAPFYSWPTLATLAAWKRQPGSGRFVYAIRNALELRRQLRLR